MSDIRIDEVIDSLELTAYSSSEDVVESSAKYMKCAAIGIEFYFNLFWLHVKMYCNAWFSNNHKQGFNTQNICTVHIINSVIFLK